MDIDEGFIVLIGVSCFLWTLLYFLALRRVNRFVIFLLAVSFLCFGIATGLHAWEDYQHGIAHIPAGRRTTTEIPLNQFPGLFWSATTFMWVCAAALLIMGGYFLRIALMRRGRRA